MFRHLSAPRIGPRGVQTSTPWTINCVLFRGHGFLKAAQPAKSQEIDCEGSGRDTLETVRAAIAQWPERVKVCVEAEGGHFSGIITNKNLKLLLIDSFSRKVDVLFHFPSRPQYTWDRTYGRAVYFS